MLGYIQGSTELIKGLTYTQTKFKEAYINAITEGELIYSLLKDHNRYQSHLLNLSGFSLGTVLINSLLQTAIKDKNNSLLFNNIILMGGCLSSENFYSNIHNLLSENSCFLGKVYIVYSENDQVLKSLLPIVQTDNCFPIGLYQFDYVKAAKFLLTNNLHINHYKLKYRINDTQENENKLINFLKSRIISISVSNEVGQHWNYRKKLSLIFAKIREYNKNNFC